MASQQPFTILNEVVNPMIANAPRDNPPSQDPLLKTFKKRTYTGVKTSSSALIDLYAYKSEPAIVIGDHRAYKTGTRDIKQGFLKAKFWTQQVVVSEDELERIEQNAGSAADIIGGSVEDQIKRNDKYFIKELRRVAINGLPWLASGGELEGDSQIVKMLGGGTTGNISDPYDLNAIAGTPAALTATVILSGSNKTANNIQAIFAELFKGVVVVDADTHVTLGFDNIHMGCDSYTMGILKGNQDILNSTTGQLSPNSYKTDIENRGVTIIEDQNFDADHAAAEDDTAVLTFWAEPSESMHMIVVKSAGGKETWSAWRQGERLIEEGELKVIEYNTSKSHEIGFWPQAYWMRKTSGADGAFYKKVYRIDVTTFDNVD